jgi:hypothetical protein
MAVALELPGLLQDLSGDEGITPDEWTYTCSHGN